MIETINEKINVIAIYNHEKRRTIPWKIKWNGRIYTIKTVGYHYTKRHGQVLHHLFSVAAGSLYFLLQLNTETLIWTLLQTSDQHTI